jgi:hypothetical protein
MAGKVLEITREKTALHVNVDNVEELEDSIDVYNRIGNYTIGSELGHNEKEDNK